ncbi:tripartite tricarboxylate transporter substrate binding protein [Azohydromonas aeria]|uniref:tripartite tricarboxylate transporter substrate binding protein n=1 Tax=Azohydromonas aeria TaxID=2590212 RepID=UPI0012FCCDFD|nr:tripartite tricarboxylate transporter substrate binding protein [Azohydromonas aeria]
MNVVRRRLLAAAPVLAAAALAPAAGPALAQAYPAHAIELVVPFQPGGGTDALARAFADASRKHLPQSMVVVNRPGASGAIGWGEVINAKPDGYKLAVITVELVTLPHLGLARFSHEDLQPIARLNADQAAITVRADAPWNSVEEFLAATKKEPERMRVGNSGNGSIWHLAAAALEDKTGVKFSHIPFQGAGPAVQALMGGHIEAVAVSPAEVSTYVQGGKLKTLAVMAEQRVKGFEKVPTLRERGIDLVIGTWRGIAAPRNTPPDVLATLRAATARIAQEPQLREAMDRLNLGYSYGDDQSFRGSIERDNAYFKPLMARLNLKN